jgi:hypothetical protein
MTRRRTIATMTAIRMTHSQFPRFDEVGGLDEDPWTLMVAFAWAVWPRWSVTVTVTVVDPGALGVHARTLESPVEQPVGRLV